MSDVMFIHNVLCDFVTDRDILNVTHFTLLLLLLLLLLL